MKKIVFVGLVIAAAAVIVSSFFMPWAKLSASVTKISQELTGKGAGKFIKGLEKITGTLGVLGDVEVRTAVSGYDIPTMVNKKSSKVAISLAQGLFKDAKDLDKKSNLLFLVPLFAIVCVALAVVGIRYKLAVALMSVLSGAISLGGLYNLKTADFSNLSVKITVEKGLWHTIYAYLFIFILSIIWLVTDKTNSK